MDLHVESWLAELTGRIRGVFGARLIYIGHTGSYARGEAKATSDIDVNVVLDELHMGDLRMYRKIIQSMPNSEKACGFIGGKAEMIAWPKHELFQFLVGSHTLYGTLDGIVDLPDDADIAEHIRITASAIYHEACHRYIYGADFAEEAEQLATAFKAAFFVMQEQVYLLERDYVPTHAELIDHLDGVEREVLETSMKWDELAADRAVHPERYFEMLHVWSSAAMCGLGVEQTGTGQ